MGETPKHYKWMIIPGLIGLLFFLVLMPWSHPPAYLSELAGENELVAESRRFLEQSGFEMDQLKPFVLFRTNDDLLRQQISHFGKKQLIFFIQNVFLRFIPSYHWQVTWIDTAEIDDVSITMDSYRQPAGTALFRSIHSADGALQQFSILKPRGSEYRRAPPPSDETASLKPDFSFLEPGPLGSELPEHRHLKKLIRGTIWDNYLMKIDSTYFSEQEDIRLHNIVLSPETEIFEHVTSAKISLTLDGLLYEISQDVIISGQTSPQTGQPEGFIRGLFYICSILLLLVLFVRRIFHRIVDLRMATIYGAIAASIALMHIIQLMLQSTAFSYLDQQLLQVIALLFILVVISGIMGIFVFILAGLGESLTREIWPEKLTTTALIRLGYFNSSSLGRSVAAGVLAAFVYLGLAAIIYTLSDNSYLNLLENQFFYSDSFLFPAWQVLVRSLLWTFLITAGLFACFLSWVAINRNNNLLLLSVGAVAFSLMSSYMLITPDSFLILLIWLIPGIAVTWVFLKQDLLALLVSVFLFIAAWSTVDGRVVAGSPDALFSWAVIIFMGLALAVSILLAEYGKQYDHIPELIPKYIREIAREQRVERELEIARQVHQSFLPVNLPALEGLEIAAGCHAAFDVGGDYYDVIPIDDHRMAFVIGDVSGKGIQAAFFMTMVKGIFQSLVKEIPQPVPLLTRMNRLFYENARRGSFISICYGLVDVRDGTLKYARAGHNPAIIIRYGEKKAEMLRSGGIAIGLTKTDDFEESLEEVTLTMNTGDTIIFYTDGITEAANPSNQMYGEERLLADAGKFQHPGAQDLLDQLRASIKRFTASIPVNDDMTMVVVRYVGSGPGSDRH